jgi:hypothetical protein
MGAWGTAIFSDDFALDVKGEYQTLLAFGTPEDKAFNLTKKYFFNEGIEGTEDEPVFWLAIASIQQRYGILSAEVKEAAIHYIDGGSAMQIWEESASQKDIKKRKQVLDNLKKLLIDSPLHKKKVPKPDSYSKPRWQIGDLVLSQIAPNANDGYWYINKYVLYRVVKINQEPLSNIAPDLAYCEFAYGVLYDWIGDEVPNVSIVKDLSYFKRNNDNWSLTKNTPFGIYLLSMDWIPRNERFTLLQRDCEHPMPSAEEICADNGSPNILGLFNPSKSGDYFKELYEKLRV